VYAAIGVIAMLSFLQLRHGGADESSLLVILNKYVIGKIFIFLILLGSLCYITWRFYETIKDPYDYGKDWRGLIKRSGIALSSVADALIVYTAIRVLVGGSEFQPDGQPQAERHMARNILQQYGGWLLISLGAFYLATAVIQLLYGITRGYKERVEIERFSSFMRNTIHVLAWAGYFGRGIILGITGFFFVKAGITENARHVVNTDKAFDFIGDHVGHIWFILVAAATICYGLFMFALGVAYDSDKD
jgi:hypothetical protein